MTILKEVTLENGLKIAFADESNRYFGDYHRICMVASINCQLKGLSFGTDEENALCQKAIEKFGESLTVTKRFERMGVASDDLDSVRTSMIEDFLRHTADYLSRPDYPLSMIKSELNKKPVQRFYA